MAMSPIRPELGRQDWSPVARGGQAFGQGVGQGLAQLGAGIGQAIQRHREKKQDKAEFEEFRKVAEGIGLAPDESKVVWNTAGKQGAFAWLQQEKNKQQTSNEISLGMQILDNINRSGEDFSLTDYMSWYQGAGGQNPDIALQVLELGKRFGKVPEELSEKDQAQIDLYKAQAENLRGGKPPSPSEVDQSLDNAAQEFVGKSEQEKSQEYGSLDPSVRARVDEIELNRRAKEKSLEPSEGRPFTKAERERQYEREIDGITLGEYARKLRDLKKGATRGQLDAKWWKPGMFEQDRIEEFDRILSQNPELFLEGTPQSVIDNIGKGTSFSVTPGGSGIRVSAR
jgi:hypothetical protein